MRCRSGFLLSKGQTSELVLDDCVQRPWTGCVRTDRGSGALLLSFCCSESCAEAVEEVHSIVSRLEALGWLQLPLEVYPPNSCASYMND